jgi:hypothetical protein
MPPAGIPSHPAPGYFPKPTSVVLWRTAARSYLAIGDTNKGQATPTLLTNPLRIHRNGA